MIDELRCMLKLDELSLNYVVKIADFDGENFTYTVTESSCDNDALAEKIKDALEELQEDVECGYIDVYEEGKVGVYQDTGNSADPLQAVHKVLYALNEVPEIKEVIINDL